MWRKTRQPSSATCFGSDPNRNWDYRWNTGGTSTNPCSDIFPGASPFSEPETLALSRLYASVPDLAIYIAQHSFSQMWLYPPGWTTNPAIGNQAILHQIGEAAAQATRDFSGFNYRVGTPGALLGEFIGFIYFQIIVINSYTFTNKKESQVETLWIGLNK
jgi:Zinc carboxypeptidase